MAAVPRGRFFKHLSDSETESDESDAEVQPVVRPQPTIPAAYTFSDDEEDTKRIVRTAREKRYEELQSVMKLIRNHKKIKDISKLLTEFENLAKAHVKAKPVIDKEEKGVTPRFYIKCLVEIEDFVNDTWTDKEGRKNMSKNNSKSLATLRQKLRKYNKDFEEQIRSYRENPDEEKSGNESEDGESDASDNEKEVDKIIEDKRDLEAPEVAKSKFVRGVGSDEESESTVWDSSEDESSLSSDYAQYEVPALAFLKKEGEPKEAKKKKSRKERPKRMEEEEEEEGEGVWEKVKGGTVVAEKPKMFAKDEEITHEALLKKLREILAMRGKKRIQRTDQIEMLRELLDLAENRKLGPAMSVKIIYGIVAAHLDYNPNISSCMKPDMWDKCLESCNQLMDILINNPDISMGENISEESESFVTSPYRVHGAPLTLIERMEEEFTKMLQAVDAHSPDYIERLKDEKAVYNIIYRFQTYLETNMRGNSSDLCRIYILRVDHIYYKFDPDVFEHKKRKQNCENENSVNGVIDSSSLDLMDKLCKYIYAKDTTDRIRTQAILFHIYHHALHDNWYEARDLMLMSHLQIDIQKADIPLQIIYNRALVQLGLCAFRHGMIKDAHANLLDIQIQGRAKELLAQGLVPKLERTIEQEKLEKRRLLPFHKHINLELLECVYLVSAMLLEIPDVAANEYSVRKKIISKSFYNQLRKNEEQPLVGLPESMREHVVAASKVMRVGNWMACVEFIINEKMNAKIWNLFHQTDKVKAMLVQKIREESLRAYLFTYSHIYDSISLYILSEMFDLEKPTVHSIISKMIINEELMASLDEPTQALVMHRTEPSRIQSLSLQLADKVNSLVDHNERIWELKQMGTFGSQSNRMGYSGRDYGGRGERRGSQRV